MTAALLTALEGAEEGSSELDAQIALSIGWTHEAWPEQRERKPWWRKPETPKAHWYNRYEKPPQFSQSIDAALSLARETMKMLGHSMYEIHARIVHDDHRGATAFMEITVPSREYRGFGHGGDAEARGLIAAALRARLAATGTVEE